MTCQSVENVATFCDNHFFYEPGTVIVGNLYSVSSPEMADMMKKRDFVRFGPTHITEMNALPTCRRQQAMRRNPRRILPGWLGWLLP
jgi:hypothetical protein